MVLCVAYIKQSGISMIWGRFSVGYAFPVDTISNMHFSEISVLRGVVENPKSMHGTEILVPSLK